MATQSEVDAELQKLRDEIAEVRTQNEKAWGIARDCINALTNAKVTAGGGQLGTLSHSNVLSDAPVGDAIKFRSNIGLGAAARYGTLPGWYGAELPRNDDGTVVSARQLLDILDVMREITSITSGRGSEPVLHTRKIEASAGIIVPNGGIGDIAIAARLFTDPGISDIYSEAAGGYLRPCSASGYYPGGYDRRLNGVWLCLGVCGGMDSTSTSICVWRRIR